MNNGSVPAMNGNSATAGTSWQSPLLIKPIPLQEGSEEEFITEHFWGYAKYSAVEASEYHVAHPRWNMFKVDSHTVRCDFKSLYGEAFSPLNKPGTGFGILLPKAPILKCIPNDWYRRMRWDSFHCAATGTICIPLVFFTVITYIWLASASHPTSHILHKKTMPPLKSLHQKMISYAGKCRSLKETSRKTYGLDPHLPLRSVFFFFCCCYQCFVFC